MNPPPIPDAPQTEPQQTESQQIESRQPTAYHLQVVHELLAIGLDLMRLVQQQAHAEVETAARLGEPAPDFTAAAERMSRTVRRTALLADKLLQPAKAARAARKQIIRAVEESIERDAPAAEAEGLQAELYERLESPELVEELGDRPVGDIIAEIQRDLGIARSASGRLWKRRTPQDVALLCARAAIPLPAVGPFVLPMPPRGWTPAAPLFGTAETELGRRRDGPRAEP